MRNFPDQFNENDWTAPQQEWKEIAASFDKSVRAHLPTDLYLFFLSLFLSSFFPPSFLFFSHYVSFFAYTHRRSSWTNCLYLLSLYKKQQIFLDTPKGITRERLARRHLEAGIAKNMAEAEKRAGGSDARNADDILRWRGRVDILINGSDFTKMENVMDDDSSSTTS